MATKRKSDESGSTVMQIEVVVSQRKIIDGRDTDQVLGIYAAKDDDDEEDEDDDSEIDELDEDDEDEDDEDEDDEDEDDLDEDDLDEDDLGEDEEED